MIRYDNGNAFRGLGVAVLVELAVILLVFGFLRLCGGQ